MVEKCVAMWERSKTIQILLAWMVYGAAPVAIPVLVAFLACYNYSKRGDLLG